METIIINKEAELNFLLSLKIGIHPDPLDIGRSDVIEKIINERLGIEPPRNTIAFNAIVLDNTSGEITKKVDLLDKDSSPWRL